MKKRAGSSIDSAAKAVTVCASSQTKRPAGWLRLDRAPQKLPTQINQTVAALPQHSAERLCLSGSSILLSSRLCLDTFGGGASEQFRENSHGEASLTALGGGRAATQSSGQLSRNSRSIQSVGAPRAHLSFRRFC